MTNRLARLFYAAPNGAWSSRESMIFYKPVAPNGAHLTSARAFQQSTVASTITGARGEITTRTRANLVGSLKPPAALR